VVGEDVAAGQLVIGRGVRVRPAEIGGLMALGITRLRVAMKPRVALLSTGDEVVRAEDRPRKGQVRDVNSGALAALARDSGGEPILHGIVPDEIAIIQEVAAGALATSDLLVISGGSSASARDVTAKVIGALGEPGVLIHGISIRPGKPTILGVCGGKCVIGLPGNPVSALVIGYLFMVPVIELLLGLDSDRPRPRIAARVTINLPSQAGREDWWPVKVTRSGGGRDEWLAEPIFSRSNLIFGLSTADGLLCIPAATTGIAAGEVADVHLV
jgi:molybdopterin molybdotransferase